MSSLRDKTKIFIRLRYGGFKRKFNVLKNFVLCNTDIFNFVGNLPYSHHYVHSSNAYYDHITTTKSRKL